MITRFFLTFIALAVLTTLPLAHTQEAHIAEIPTSAPDAQNVEYVSSIGGAILDVAVQGNYAFIGVGRRLTILDQCHLVTRPPQVEADHLTDAGLVLHNQDLAFTHARPSFDTIIVPILKQNPYRLAVKSLQKDYNSAGAYDMPDPLVGYCNRVRAELRRATTAPPPGPCQQQP